ncbi:hypothetical protein [Neolewinella persica]|uniref:hypothetical protein n=1 Tax=Neolewinella persica TaxID=70998 RepID=UPI00036AD386|nr:hypothetical protein [Neolewinella persica]
MRKTIRNSWRAGFKPAVLESWITTNSFVVFTFFHEYIVFAAGIVPAAFFVISRPDVDVSTELLRSPGMKSVRRKQRTRILVFLNILAIPPVFKQGFKISVLLRLLSGRTSTTACQWRERYKWPRRPYENIRLTFQMFLISGRGRRYENGF